MAERKRSKIGRMSRLRGQIETAGAGSPVEAVDKVEATVRAMGEAGAPEADIQALIAGEAA